MRWLISLVALCACGKGSSSSSSCPTVDELMHGDESIRRDNEILVATCRADGWSKAVTTCLRDAKDDLAMEKCFKLLSPDQQKRFEAALGPLDDLIADERAKEKAELDAKFRREIDELHLDALVARAPQCAGYREAMEAVRKATQTSCGADDQLEMFGVRETVMKAARTLVAIADDKQLDDACAAHAVALRKSVDRVCSQRRE